MKLTDGALLKILDALPVGIRAVDPGGDTVYTNQAGVMHAYACDSSHRPQNDELIVQVNKFGLATGDQDLEVYLTHNITEQSQREADLRKRAYFDALTGLPNRVLLEEKIGSLIEKQQSKFALAFIDLDGFKHINDCYGHAVGDALLAGISRRLKRELRGNDTLARVGGDEFILCMSPINSTSTASYIVDRCLAHLKEPFFIDDREILTSASIGVSVYPDDGDTFGQLCANADQAMYGIKALNKGRFQFYSPEDSDIAGAKMRAEQQLRSAVRDYEMCCAYQPKVDFRTGEVTGVEVLLRWCDAYGKTHIPYDFAAAAEELGLLDQITYQMLEHAVSAFDQIDNAFGNATTISINIAARQADDPAFMRSFVAELESTGIAGRFILELTEEAFISRSRFQERILPMIRETGARISIDDFGTGYSSLSALAGITADEVKVDRSFISNIHTRPRNQGILRAIESLATALDMAVVVEGVETVEELLYLQGASNIRVAQGFYFAKPMFLDELTSVSFELPVIETVPSLKPKLVCA